MPPKKGQGRAKRSHPDAEEVTAEGKVNIDVDIHTAPKEDMPAEAVQLQAKAVQPQAEAMPPTEIGRATSRSNLRLVVQPVVAICDWSCN